MGHMEGASMNKHLTREGFAAVILRLTDRMKEEVECINNAVIAGDDRREVEHRAIFRAYDMAIFTLTLNTSTIVDEKYSNEQNSV